MRVACDGNKYSDRVEATLAPSRIGRGLATFAALATVALACSLPVALEWRAAAVCAVALGWHRTTRRLTLPCVLSFDGSALAVDGVGGSVSPGSFVAPWLTCMRWRPHGAWRDRAVLVLPDMLRAEDFRRMRVLLKA